jgi:hypothetical protein
MKKIVALTAAALLSASSTAYAAMADWSAADADGDGKVTEAEFTTANPDAADQFAGLDADSSGNLSADEYKAGADATGSMKKE